MIACVFKLCLLKFSSSSGESAKRQKDTYVGVLFLCRECHIYPSHHGTPTGSDWEAERPPAVSGQIQFHLTHKTVFFAKVADGHAMAIKDI